MSDTIQISNDLIEEISVEKKLHTRCAESIMKDNNFRTLNDTEEILYYVHGVYVPNGEIIIKEECQKRVRNCTTRLCNEVINTIKRSTYVDRKRFLTIPNLVNVKNGIYNIEKRTLLPHSPSYLFRIQHPIECKLGIKTEEFMKFLTICLPDYKDRITVLEEIASIFLYGVKFEKAFMHVGSGSNGKSTLFHIIECVAGDENASHISIHELAENRFAASKLDGKCLNTCAEISDEDLRQTRKLKSLISGDSIEVEKKGKDMFSMKNYARMFFSANKLPEISKFGEAELRRFIVTKWNQKFASDPSQKELESGIKKQDIELNKKLTSPEELSGIFNLVMFYARKLLKENKFTFEQSVQQLQTEWKEKKDHISKFAQTSLKSDLSSVIPKSKVFESYKTWCNENKMISKSQREFNSRIKNELSLEDDRMKINGKTTVVWKDLKFTELLKLSNFLTGSNDKTVEKKSTVTSVTREIVSN